MWHFTSLEVSCAANGSSNTCTDGPAALSREEEAKVFTPKEGAEKFTFQAEVNRLMDIIIHSLYSNKVRDNRHGCTAPCIAQGAASPLMHASFPGGVTWPNLMACMLICR